MGTRDVGRQRGRTRERDSHMSGLGSERGDDDVLEKSRWWIFERFQTKKRRKDLAGDKTHAEAMS